MLLLVVLASLANAGPASADPLLDQKKAQYDKVQNQVHALDDRVEMLTERYDQAVERLRQLKHQIADANRRLAAAQAHLEYEQGVLSQLMVARYKGVDADTLDIILGASSLDEVTGSLDVKKRFDDAVTSAVDEIRITRDAIAQERLVLIAARAEARKQKHVIERKRNRIRMLLHHRRQLMRRLGNQVRVAEAASSINQTKIALEAQAWITADKKANLGDPGAELRDQVALEGLRQIGVPYKWGGASPETGFDCSGLMMWLYAKHGVVLPHFAASQYHLGPQITKAELRPGDLVFFHDLGHVGMYIGNGWVVHAPHTGDFVRMAPFSMGWFQSTYVGATQPGPA